MIHSQECEDNSMWLRHLSVAYWVFAVASTYLLFSDRLGSGLIALGVGLSLFVARLRLERKHFEWHIAREEEENND